MAFYPIEEHEYRYRPLGGSFTAWAPCTPEMAQPNNRVRIPVGDIEIAEGDMQVRLMASGARPAGNILASPVAFTQTPAENTTPAAPTVTADDELNILTASHALGDSEIVYSENGGAFVQYTGALSIGDVARPTGYWQFKVKAAAGRNESPVTGSPAFTVAPVDLYPAKLHFAGDSITAGYVATSWAEVLKGTLNTTQFPTAGYNNTAVSNQASNQQLARVQQYIIANKGAGGTYLQDIAITMVGVNDLRIGDDTMPHHNLRRPVEDVVHDILEWGRQCRLAGIKPILITMTADRMQSGSWIAEDDLRVQRMQEINALTVANAETYGFMGVVDMRDNAFVGMPSSPITYQNTYWTTDLIHPNNAGEQVIASLAKPVIEAVADTPMPAFDDPGEYGAEQEPEETKIFDSTFDNTFQ